MNGLTTAFTGRVTGDPEQRFTATGKAMLKFSAVVDQSFTATEQRAAPEPIYVRVTAWEPSEELLGQLRKGSLIYCEGRLTHDAWQAKDGASKCGLGVSAWRVDVHGVGQRAPRRSTGVPAEGH